MGSISLTIPRGEATQEAGLEGPRAAPVIRFLDEEGRPVGRPRRPELPPPLHLEAPGSGGEIRTVEVAPPASLRTAPPSGAVAVELVEEGRARTVVPLTAARRTKPTPPLSKTLIGPTRPKVVLAVMAERFDDQGDFLDHCAFLHQRIVATPPFDQAPDGIGIVALFWSTDPNVGQLRVPQPTNSADLIHGDLDLSKKFLKKAKVKSDRALVLINFPRRGGAGGTEEFPAWVTNTSSATDTWEQVAIHELGHAFGLGDEYQSPGPSGIGSRLEPNISNKADPLAAPWKALVTAPTPKPTASSGSGAQLPPGLIGAFEGARYEPHGLFRPCFRCMMRNTQDPFCPVCHAHILGRLQT